MLEPVIRRSSSGLARRTRFSFKMGLMNIRRWLITLLLLVVVACTQTPDTPGTATVEPTSTLRLVTPQVTSAPNVQAAARAFLEAWKAEDYAAMYSMLTSPSQDAISLEEFTRHYESIAIEATLSGLDYEVLQSLTEPDFGQVSYRVILHSTLVGDIIGETSMNLSMEHGEWRVQWADTLVLPQLEGGNYLKMDLEIPARANIYDRNGHALVAQADATAIGLQVDLIDPDPDARSALYSALSRVTGMRADTIAAKVDAAYAGDYIQLGEVPADRVAANYSLLESMGGPVLRPNKWRFYYDGGVAPHVIGYVAQIREEQLEEYLRRGYRPDERVGQSGLERWAEPYLAGKRGGALYVLNAQGQPLYRLAETPVEPAQAVFTTIDRDFQLGVQQAIAGFRGSVVVLERDTGRVLAMASSPGFDPNAYEPRNFNYSALLSEIWSDPASPEFNRAAQGQYPLGSVFKIITTAAALEDGGWSPDDVLECGYTYQLGTDTLYDWTYEHFQNDGRTQPSGPLTLMEGLVRSCNPWFYHLGQDLFNRGLTKAISNMALGFGLGVPTGIQVVDEASGNVPEPISQRDAANLAIGQGEFLVTPLQVADFIAAVGNGGTLYRPQVIERIAPPDGEPTFEFQPEERGKLPISEENLQAIQEAMVGVVRSTRPRGTAYHVFSGLDFNVAGKTGTAQSSSGLPHAWFAGYTFQGREDKPDIAIAVVVENIGEGSDYAAPIFRRIVELYFYGQPAKLYWWESTYGVTRTPTPEFEETPTPEEDEVEEGEVEEGQEGSEELPPEP